MAPETRHAHITPRRSCPSWLRAVMSVQRVLGPELSPPAWTSAPDPRADPGARHFRRHRGGRGVDTNIPPGRGGRGVMVAGSAVYGGGGSGRRRETTLDAARDATSYHPSRPVRGDDQMASPTKAVIRLVRGGPKASPAGLTYRELGTGPAAAVIETNADPRPASKTTRSSIRQRSRPGGDDRLAYEVQRGGTRTSGKASTSHVTWTSISAPRQPGICGGPGVKTVVRGWPAHRSHLASA